MLKQTITHESNCPVILVDSITKVDEGDEGAIVISGSHGGRSSGEFALAVPFTAVFFNDGGIGKDEAGIVGLGMLDEKNIPACAVSHETGRIGDAADMWEHGVLSRVNAAAAARGATRGMAVRDAVRELARQAARGGEGAKR
jgi:hypothetical protein